MLIGKITITRRGEEKLYWIHLNRGTYNVSSDPKISVKGGYYTLDSLLAKFHLTRKDVRQP